MIVNLTKVGNEAGTVEVKRATIRDRDNRILAEVTSQEQVVVWLSQHKGGPYRLHPEELGYEVNAKATDMRTGDLGMGNGQKEPQPPVEAFTSDYSKRPYRRAPVYDD